MTLLVPLSVRNRVKDDPTERAAVSHSFMRRLVIIIITKMVKLCHYVHLIKENDISKTYQMSQFVLVQFSIKSGGKGKIALYPVL